MQNSPAIRLSNVTVGYGSRPVIRQIQVDFLRGKMTCLLGSNGTGKTTMLKTIAGIIPPLEGEVSILDRPLQKFRPAELAKKMAVVLTNKIDIENLTGFEVAAMGRYPHTGFFCRLTEEDVRIVEKYLALCSAESLRDTYFHQMSDGERQKIMLARGLAQEAEILMLDEPTSHLDIKHKLDLLYLLRRLCLEEHRTILCTLHEPDLAIKCCDQLVLVKEDRVLAAGETEKIIASGLLDQLYGFSQHQFDPSLGTIEFPNLPGKDVFLIGSDSHTPMLLRNLNKFFRGIGMGILQENDIACHIASNMNIPVATVPPFAPVTDEDVDRAFETAVQYPIILLSDFPLCPLTEKNRLLADRLRAQGKSVISLADTSPEEVLVKICHAEKEEKG
ncbi:MAG: ABC transporter ATP-binding protein [Candidatus Merdivicinus sp.]|jgi:iron complex transport system ATP-binding protein